MLTIICAIILSFCIFNIFDFKRATTRQKASVLISLAASIYLVLWGIETVFIYQ